MTWVCMFAAMARAMAENGEATPEREARNELVRESLKKNELLAEGGGGDTPADGEDDEKPAPTDWSTCCTRRARDARKGPRPR